MHVGLLIACPCEREPSEVPAPVPGLPSPMVGSCGPVEKAATQVCVTNVSTAVLPFIYVWEGY